VGDGMAGSLGAVQAQDDPTPITGEVAPPVLCAGQVYKDRDLVTVSPVGDRKAEAASGPAPDIADRRDPLPDPGSDPGFLQ
jgi:hypothetical protein